MEEKKKKERLGTSYTIIRPDIFTDRGLIKIAKKTVLKDPNLSEKDKQYVRSI